MRFSLYFFGTKLKELAWNLVLETGEKKAWSLDKPRWINERWLEVAGEHL